MAEYAKAYGSYSPLDNDTTSLLSCGKLDGYLPPRTFIKSKRRHICARALWQASAFIPFVGIPATALVLWIGFGSGASYYYSYYSDSCVEDSAFAPTTTIPGTFSFAQAKTIDLAWNLCVGRVTQGIMGLVLYGVATTTLQRITEMTPVSYSFFIATSLFPSNIQALGTLFKGVFSNRGWRAKVATIWLLISCALVLVIPTIMDAMTGYVQAQTRYIITHDKKLVKFYDVETIPYNATTQTPYWNETTFYAPSSYRYESKNIQCVNDQGDKYEWGFAGSVTLYTLVVLLAWGLGTWGIWLDGQHNCQQRRKGRTMNIYGAICDLGEAFSTALGPHTSAYAGSEIRKALKKRPGIMYSVEARSPNLSHISLSSRQDGKLKLSFNEMYG